MAEKHRGDIELIYPNGLFRENLGIDTLQLYQIYERELNTAKSLEVPAFPAGILLVFCMTGRGVFKGENIEIPFSSDTVVCAPAQGRYTVDICEGEKSLRYVCFNLSVTKRLASHTFSALHTYYLQNRAVHVADGVFELKSMISQIIGELCLPQFSRSLIKGLLYQMLVIAYRHFEKHDASSESSEPVANAVGHTVYAIIRYIDDHLYSMNNLMSMAEELGYSYNYLSHLFRRKTGMTIQTYVSRKKIEKSTELLAQEQYSITEIASMLNYDCIQSFSKAFKRAMNMSPTEYRALYGGGQAE